jgi:DNA (cytosine-5)-methyltransferase 1
MTANGIAYQLPVLARLTEGIESGSWPTPLARDWKGTSGGHQKDRDLPGKVGVWFRTPIASEGKEPTGSLSKQIQNGHPNLNKDGSVVAHLLKNKNMPTPTARDWKGGYNSKSLTRKDGKSRHLDALPNAVLGGLGTDQVPGKLNPTWVEWLMGYPAGWTDLKD